MWFIHQVKLKNTYNHKASQNTMKIQQVTLMKHRIKMLHL
ncbi:ORF060 [Staphylococcus phage 66]|uniref:ORF060 n=1 Tax=Staphylococcus phage 66 TaxID=320832 RepID=Q4ZE59_9CAUD|nr:ORF060 [Staphylococcus phage 66]AAX90678.1 ORF060 [Staphylococcus phage 66]